MAAVKKSVSVSERQWLGALNLANLRAVDEVIGASQVVQEALAAYLSTATPDEEEHVVVCVARLEMPLLVQVRQDLFGRATSEEVIEF